MTGSSGFSSILVLIGQGCHRVSEIAGRLQTNAAALTRPLDLLVQLGLVRREVPSGGLPLDALGERHTLAR